MSFFKKQKESAALKVWDYQKTFKLCLMGAGTNKDR